MLKGLLAAFSAALLGAMLHAPAAAAPKLSDLKDHSLQIPAVNVDTIRRIRCAKSHGTGFMVGKDTMITAHHVIDGATGCVDDETGNALEVISFNRDQDTAVVRFANMPKRWLKVDCGRFVTDQTYYALGFAGVGQADIMLTRMRGRANYESGRDGQNFASFWAMRSLAGVIIGGMSGGPIINDRGHVVGMNNLTGDYYKTGLSREMADTYLCNDGRDLTVDEMVNRASATVAPLSFSKAFLYPTVE